MKNQRKKNTNQKEISFDKNNYDEKREKNEVCKIT
jgi:hypothetical protein